MKSTKEDNGPRLTADRRLKGIVKDETSHDSSTWIMKEGHDFVATMVVATQQQSLAEQDDKMSYSMGQKKGISKEPQQACVPW